MVDRRVEGEGGAAEESKGGGAHDKEVKGEASTPLTRRSGRKKEKTEKLKTLQREGYQLN